MQFNKITESINFKVILTKTVLVRAIYRAFAYRETDLNIIFIHIFKVGPCEIENKITLDLRRRTRTTAPRCHSQWRGL